MVLQLYGTGWAERGFPMVKCLCLWFSINYTRLMMLFLSTIADLQYYNYVEDNHLGLGSGLIILIR